MDQTQKCVLCEHPESKFQGANVPLISKCTCSRCGQYYISRPMIGRLSGQYSALSSDDKFKLSCVANEWHTIHPYTPFVLAEEGDVGYSAQAAFPDCRVFTITEMLAEFPKPTEVMDRILLRLSRMVLFPTKTIELSDEEAPFIFFSPQNEHFVMAVQMVGLGLLSNRSVQVGGDSTFTIAPDGWKRIEELGQVNLDSDQAFIAMWFSEEMNDALENGLKKGIEDAGYKPQIINEKHHNNKICDEIIAEIRKSRFIVADFTAGKCEKCSGCEKKADCEIEVRPRGGVYYEAGFAQGLGIEVIWTVREDQIGEVHFDTNHYNHITYTNATELRQKLKARIEATVGRGPNLAPTE